MKSYFTLPKNEVKLNIRDMNMVLFAVFMPLVILVILGIIYGMKPAADQKSETSRCDNVGTLLPYAGILWYNIAN